MSNKKIVVSGKEIDYGDMSNEKLMKLYNELLKRQDLIREKARNSRKNQK